MQLTHKGALPTDDKKMISTTGGARLTSGSKMQLTRKGALPTAQQRDDVNTLTTKMRSTYGGVLHTLNTELSSTSNVVPDRRDVARPHPHGERVRTRHRIVLYVGSDRAVGSKTSATLKTAWALHCTK